MLDAVLKHLQDDSPNAVERLKRLLAIPSVSTDPDYVSHIGAAAGFVDNFMRDAGLDTHVHTTGGHPIVFGSNTSDDLPDDVPHVLYYGHYDVQPPDPLEGWDTPPFEPTVRDGAIYARGASDDKGQICCFLEALAAWRKVHGQLPIRVTVLIEGEEECGSNHLHTFLESNTDEITADVVLISDTTMWDEQTVAITYGLRGMLYYDIKLHGPSRDLHSGMYGGTLANPATILTRVLGQLFDDEHKVTIPGFYDDVLPIDPAERDEWQKLGFDEIEHCLGPVGVDTPFGEAGFTTLERKWARPACDINGIYGGYGGAGAKTVIPRFAGAKVSFRLAPNQDPAKIAKQFEAWLKSFDVHGLKWELTNFGEALPVVVSRDSPFIGAAQKAVEACSGKPAVMVREGATIPVVGEFKQLLNMDSLLIGFGLDDDAIHSPNEKFNLNCFSLGCQTHAALIAEIANIAK